MGSAGSQAVVFLAKLFKNRTIDRCGFLVFGLVAAQFAVLAKKDEVTRTMYKNIKFLTLCHVKREFKQELN